MKFVYHLFQFFYWILTLILTSLFLPRWCESSSTLSQHQPYRTIRLTPFDAGILLEVTKKKLPFPWFHPLLSPLFAASTVLERQSGCSSSRPTVGKFANLWKNAINEKRCRGEHPSRNFRIVDSRQEQRDPRTNRLKFTAVHRGGRVHVGKSVAAPPTLLLLRPLHSRSSSPLTYPLSLNFGRSRIEEAYRDTADFFSESMKVCPRGGNKFVFDEHVQDWMRYKGYIDV